MGLISQKSRVKHHTVTYTGTTGTTFTVPSTEDFTLGGWTIYDLAKSEFGVDEGRNKLYVRIGNNVNEIPLNVSGGTGSSVWSAGAGTGSIVSSGNVATTSNSLVFGANSAALGTGGNGIIVLGDSITGTTDNTVYAHSFEGSGLGYLLLNRLTTTQRGLLSAQNGMVIYNTTLNKFQGFENGTWTNLI